MTRECSARKVFSLILVSIELAQVTDDEKKQQSLSKLIHLKTWIKAHH